VSGDGPPAWSVGIVIPARNEADRIELGLQSVLAAAAAVPVVEVRVVVVADRCDDDTGARARACLGDRGSVITSHHGNVGAARRDGAARVLELFTGRRLDRTWLSTTDADTSVAPCWLQSQLARADEGWTAVAGIVRVDHFTEHGHEVERRWRSRYVHNDDGTHPHVHGANLGVRADAYLDVGGWPPLATAEDHELWRRLRAARWPTVATIETWVTTSGRRTGRAPEGFAGALRSLEAVP